MGVSKYLGDALMNHVFRNTAYTQVATVYLALFTSNPGDLGDGTEVSGGSYARQSVAFNAPVDVGGKSTLKNTVDITFPVATAAWGTIGYVAIMDALTSGHVLYYGPLSASKIIGIGDQFKIIAENLVIDMD